MIEKDLKAIERYCKVVRVIAHTQVSLECILLLLVVLLITCSNI